MLVYNNEVGNVVGAAGVHQLIELVASAVQPLRPGEQETQLLLNSHNFFCHKQNHFSGISYYHGNVASRP